jgi:hypothetical protein
MHLGNPQYRKPGETSHLPTDSRGGTRIVLHFKTRREKRSQRDPASKRKIAPTIEPLRGSNAPGENASILSVLARAEPRKVKNNRRFTCVEEFLVQWGPEICTLVEAQEQYTLGFDITSITSLDEGIPTQDLQPFVSVKRLTTQQCRKYKTPPPATRCQIQFAPSTKGTAHIRSIQGGPEALDTFLALEPTPTPPPAPPRSATYTARATPIKRSSSTQAPTRIKNERTARHPPPLGDRRQAGLPHRPQHDPLDEPTTNSSTSCWRRETRTGTPYLDWALTPL